jgi:flagellar biogenesis protein FliO
MSAIPQLTQAQAGSAARELIPERRQSANGFLLSIGAFMSKVAETFLWILQRTTVQRKHKSLRMCESLPLGEHRSVAVIQVDDERFLIGCSAGSVSMLSRLQESKTFSETLERCQEAGKPPC